MSDLYQETYRSWLLTLTPERIQQEIEGLKFQIQANGEMSESAHYHRHEGSNRFLADWQDYENEVEKDQEYLKIAEEVLEEKTKIEQYIQQLDEKLANRLSDHYYDRGSIETTYHNKVYYFSFLNNKKGVHLLDKDQYDKATTVEEIDKCNSIYVEYADTEAISVLEQLNTNPWIEFAGEE